MSEQVQEEKKEYAIYWKNKETGVQGQSDPMLIKAEAEEIADFLNRDPAWSHLEHWAEKVVPVEAQGS